MRKRKLVLLCCSVILIVACVLGYTNTRNKVVPGAVSGVSLEEDEIYFEMADGSRFLFAEDNKCTIEHFKEEYPDGYKMDSSLDLFKQRLYEGSLSIVSYNGNTLTYQITEDDANFYSKYLPKVTIQVDAEKKQLVILTPGTEPKYGTLYIDFKSNKVSDEAIDNAKSIQLTKTNIVVPLTDEELDRISYVTPMLYDMLCDCYGMIDLDMII